MYALTHLKKVLKKDGLIVCQYCSKSSKDLLLFSFHNVQIATIEASFHFFPTKDPCQFNRFPLVAKCITQVTSNRENTSYHRIFAQAMKQQMISRFFLNFAHIASVRHYTYPLFKLINHQNPSPCCFPCRESHLHRYPRIPSYVFGKSYLLPWVREQQQDLIENLPHFGFFYPILSSSFLLTELFSSFYRKDVISSSS